MWQVQLSSWQKSDKSSSNASNQEITLFFNSSFHCLISKILKIVLVSPLLCLTDWLLNPPIYFIYMKDSTKNQIWIKTHTDTTNIRRTKERIIVLQSRNKGKRNNNLTIYFRSFLSIATMKLFLFFSLITQGGKSQFAFKKPNEKPNPRTSS